MKLSLTMLKEYVDIPLSPQDYAQRMILSGTGVRWRHTGLYIGIVKGIPHLPCQPWTIQTDESRICGGRDSNP